MNSGDVTDEAWKEFFKNQKPPKWTMILLWCKREQASTEWPIDPVSVGGMLTPLMQQS